MNSQTRGLKVELDGLGERFLNLLFPPRCVNCKKPGTALCPSCLASIHLVSPPLCPRCGHALGIPSQCAACAHHPPVATRILFAAWHEGALRSGIHELKYNRRRDAARPLAELLVARLRQANVPVKLITFVPLHPARQAARGYNQAELLAQEAGRLLNVPVMPSLERVRETADQIGLDPAARRANVHEAFRALPAVRGVQDVILVDDVCTTGATLDACAEALFRAGVQQVYGLAVARPRRPA